jgi:predicted RNA polymerase sigma factor
MSIRQAIVNAFQYVQATFSEADVAVLEAKVQAAKPDRPDDFAFVIARNWAIDRQRKSRVAAERIVKEERKAELERRERELEAKSCQEFLEIQGRLMPTLPARQRKYLRLLWLRVFQKLDDASCAALFQGSNRDLRYQWKRRGKTLVWPHASADLREFLSRNAVGPTE